METATAFFVGFFFGLWIGMVLWFITWQEKNRVIKELKDRLKTSVDDLIGNTH